MPLMRKLGLYASIFVSFLFADESGEVAIDFSRRQEKNINETLVRDLRGIVLISSEKNMFSEKTLEGFSGVKIVDVDLPGSEGDLQNLLAQFVNQPLTRRSAQQIRNTIARYFEVNYHPLVIVQIPNQDITSRVLQVVVSESRLGEVKVEGNRKWSNLNQIKNFIQLQPGEYINDRILTADLNFINRSPYRQVEAIYEPGEDDKTTDILILVEDNQKSYQFYVGTDNTGLESTISQLTYAGFTTGNAFGLGHLFTYQYTTSDFHALQAHTAQYLAPLSNLHLLNLYGGYAHVNPSNTFPANNSSGYCVQASVRYTIPLLPTFNLKHEITAGFDYKRTNTALIFIPETALTPFNQTVNLTQFTAGYNGSYQESTFALIFLGEIFTSPFAWLPLQSNRDFSQLRPGAIHKWIYGRAAFSYYQKLPGSCYLALSMRAQGSSASLLPSEQFGLGGYNTVRGYHERVLNQDNALLLSAEFHTPSWKIAELFSKNTNISDSLQLLFFVDYSYGSNWNLIPGEKRKFLAGIGPGLRYFLDPYLNCRLDWGIKLHRDAEIGTSPGLLHFSVMASY